MDTQMHRLCGTHRARHLRLRLCVHDAVELPDARPVRISRDHVLAGCWTPGVRQDALWRFPLEVGRKGMRLRTLRSWRTWRLLEEPVGREDDEHESRRT